MGKIDSRLKVTKVERGEIYKADEHFERALNFYNGDLCVTSIIMKADTEEALKIVKVE